MYRIYRECWNQKTFNGYVDNPYWRIDMRGLSFGLKDDGEIWSMNTKSITKIDILDIQRIVDECKLSINLSNNRTE
jgi:hypothetical protein